MRSGVSTRPGSRPRRAGPCRGARAVGNDSRREREVVEHREDRQALLVRQARQELHDRDLVPQVEVDGRLVEHEDPAPLPERRRDEHQLPLAQRQRPDVPVAQALDADPRASRRRTRRRSAAHLAAPRVEPRRAARAPPSPRRSSRTAARLARHDGQAPGERPSGPSIGRPPPPSPAAPDPRWAAWRPVRHRMRVDLPAPLGPMRHTRSPGRTARSTSRSTHRSRTVRRGPAPRSRVQVTAGAPPVRPHTHPARVAAGARTRARPRSPSRCPRAARRGCAPRGPRRTMNAAPTSADSGSTERAVGPVTSRTTWGTTRPTKPMRPGQRDRGRGDQRDEPEQDAAARGARRCPGARPRRHPAAARRATALGRR